MTLASVCAYYGHMETKMSTCGRCGRCPTCIAARAAIGSGMRFTAEAPGRRTGAMFARAAKAHPAEFGRDVPTASGPCPSCSGRGERAYADPNGEDARTETCHLCRGAGMAR